MYRAFGYAKYKDGRDILLLKTTPDLTIIRNITEAKIPSKYILHQNHPNPFNPTTTIEFSLPYTEFVTLKIYNILGEDVATLISERLSSGKYKYEWDASNLASGLYLYKIQAGDFVDIKKMVLMK